ncbi:chalcone isomerase family protein [Marinobacter caseinilyticus]|uniref:chalcone isomerase family protein n=1 Tax=Marinobacter caseinilyticus TaxID=2692195 RepID=UPI00140B7486|nr:chalcone isomerase family protein [Marinobacter caseinilyticus]
MNKALSTLSACLLTAALCAPAYALTIEGVDVPDTLSADSSELTLKGAGTRSKWFMDLYVGGLYVSNTSGDAQKIIEADEPQAITLHIISGMITSERMVSATMEGFENSTGGNTAPIKAEIDTFMKVFEEEIKEGDVFDLVYVPAAGVKVMKNGNKRGQIAGLEFKKALFGIWLSEQPAQKDLKEKMLGQR